MLWLQEHWWTTSQGYAAKSARDALQRDAIEIGIALRPRGLSVTVRTRACMPCPYYITYAACTRFRQRIHESTQWPQGYTIKFCVWYISIFCHQCWHTSSQLSACTDTVKYILWLNLTILQTYTTHYDWNKIDHTPALAEYTPMYLVWITFIASGISQR